MLVGAFFLASLALATAGTAGVAARQKPGPITVRGVAAHVSHSGFSLVTHHGTYTVVLTSLTAISTLGRTGHSTVHDGDHVGVHGFLSGHTFRAMTVRIYPSHAKPKPYTVYGSVAAIRSAEVDLVVNGKRVTAVLTSSTRIQVGGAPGTAADLRPGQRIRARLQPGSGGLSVIDLHIYHQKTAAPHVQLHGVIIAVSGDALTVRVGAHTYVVKLTTTTTYYSPSGAKPAPGETGTIYACCQGQPLVATSVHLAAPPPARTTLLHGWITGSTAHSLRISTGTQTIEVTLGTLTVYSVGNAAVGVKALRIGDEVSLRVTAGNAPRATNVHVLASSRQPHTLRGTVIKIGRGSFTLLDRGRRYTVTITSGTRAASAGRPAGVSSLRPGDTVTAVGHQTGPASLAADRLTISHHVAASHTLRGTLKAIRGPVLTVADEFGVRHQVHLSRGVRVQLHGRPAPPGILVVGTRVTVRYTMSGSIYLASRVTVSVTSRSVSGRVLWAHGRDFSVSSRGGKTVRVHLDTGVYVLDGTKRVSPAGGTYVGVSGYALPSGVVLATRARLVRKAVSLSGTLTASGHRPVLQSSSGATYRLRYTSKTLVSTGRERVDLTASTVPVGAHVHVTGEIGPSGRVVVTEMTVRLTAVTERGTVAAIQGSVLTMTLPSGKLTVRTGASTTLTQGSKPLTLAGVVVGDDITVSGYAGGSGVVLARAIDVHRLLSAFDGTIASLTSIGFVLQAADGTHDVILSPATVRSADLPATLTVGLSIHVTGYRRGDGSILATRLRPGKKTP
jgi:hypothetical protein